MRFPRCWHRWLVLPDHARPYLCVRYCTKCGTTQAQAFQAFWGTKWITVPWHHWRDAVRREWEYVENRL